MKFFRAINQINSIGSEQNSFRLLKNDSQMNGLLDSLLSKNPPKDWNYVENMSSTFNFDFSVAASVLGVFEASLKNDFSKVSNLQRTFHVEFN